MSTCVVWFRKSLRLHDNPALTAACLDKEVSSIIPLYVLDPAVLGQNYENFGPSRLSFLIESLRDLDSRLSSEYASKLIILKGDPQTALEGIGQKLGRDFGSLFCEYGSEPYEREKLSSIDRSLGKNNRGLRIKTFGAFQTILNLEETISSPAYKKTQVHEGHAEIAFLELGDRGRRFLPSRRPSPQRNATQTASFLGSFQFLRATESSAFLFSR